MDGWSTFYFVQTWARIARGDTANITPPSFDSDLLRGRSPPRISFIPAEFTTDPVPAARPTLPVLVTTKFKLSREQIRSLKMQTNEGNSDTRISSFSTIAALVWKCFCISNEFAPSTQARLIFSANIRDRLSPPLLKAYFGNAVVRNFATSEVSEITLKSVNAVAQIVQAAVDGITEELIRSAIDYLEEMHTKIRLAQASPQSDFVIVSISGFPVYEADFGWGAPQKISRADLRRHSGAYVVDEPGINAGWQVLVTLDASVMPRFEKAFYEQLVEGTGN